MDASHFIAFVRSHNRQGGTSSQFSYVINLPPHATYDSVCLLQAAVPKTFYLIPNGRNTFFLVEGTNRITITIPPGNYTRRSFSATLATLLNNATTMGYLYTVTYNASSVSVDNGKYTFFATIGGVPVTIQPYFIIPAATSPALQMGFDRGSTNYFVAGVLQSSNITYLQASPVMYILCDCVSNNGTNILQDMNTTSPDFSMLIFQVGDSGGATTNQKRLIHSNNNKFNFTLTNAEDEVLDLNGVDWTCSILFWDSRLYNPALGELQVPSFSSSNVNQDNSDATSELNKF